MCGYCSVRTVRVVSTTSQQPNQLPSEIPHSLIPEDEQDMNFGADAGRWSSIGLEDYKSTSTFVGPWNADNLASCLGKGRDDWMGCLGTRVVCME